MILFVRQNNIETEDFIRLCVKKYLNLSDDNNIEIGRNKYGKPYLMNENIEFSISHSGEYIAGVFSENQVGIDIEKIIDRNYQAIVKRFFNKAENERFIEGKEEFYQLWTMKEAYSKLKGNNLNTRITREEIEGEGYIIHQINLLEGYIITIICESVEGINHSLEI